MDTKMNSATIKKIKNKTKLIIKDYKHANLIIDLLKYSQKNNESIVCASCKALATVFTHYISAKQFLKVEKITVAEEDLSKEDQFSSWLKDQFTATCEILYDFLSNESHEVKKSALKALMSFLLLEDVVGSQGVVNHLLEGILGQMTSADVDQSDLIIEAPCLWKVEKNSPSIISSCLSCLKKKTKPHTEQPSSIFQYNFWRMIKQIASQDLDDKCRCQMTGVICDFLKQKLPSGLYREILTGINVIMEKMSSPSRLTDFLSESFNIGGAISLMSLHGLFILMYKYNLDYPDFYAKLYSMFEPQVFSAKYRARFFHLADTFLTSTHLPSYLVAAFAKRLARLSLHAPASAIYIVVPFIFNLIARHPSLKVLLGRTDGTKDMISDPFMPDEKDPANCKALDSCLWELQTLEHHYDPAISQKAKKRGIPEQDLSVILETTSSDIIASYAKKVKKESVPLNFVKVTELAVFEHFSL